MRERQRAFEAFDGSDLRPVRQALAAPPAVLPAHLDPSRAVAVIGDLYATIAAPESWPEVIDRFCDLTGARGAISGVFDVHQPAVHRHSASTSMTAGELLDLLDVATEERADRFRQLYALAPQSLMLFPDPEGRGGAEADGFIRFLQEKFDLHSIVSANANPTKSWFDYCSFFFGPDDETGQTQAQATISYLLPHIAKANAACRPLDLLRRRFSAALAALDRLAHGVAIITPEAEIIAANKAMETILEDCDGLQRAADGRLTVADADAAPAFAEWAAEISDAARASRIADGDWISVPRRSGLADYVVEAAPFIDTSAGEMNARFRGAILFCIDPETPTMLTAEGLSLAYGFTPAEKTTSRNLLSGQTNRQIAEALTVSVETVKSHAKALYAKTNTRNRADFIRLAAHVSPQVLDPD